MGLLTLDLLDTWHTWVKRRVEFISFPDVATQSRHISVDFELPMVVVEAVLKAHTASDAEQGDESVTPEHVDDVWVSRPESAFALVPLTLLKKQGLTRFSLRDERGVALPLLTRDQTGAVATAVLVTFAEALCKDCDGDATVPPELRVELTDIATLPPKQAAEVWEQLDRTKKGESVRATMWREVIISDERFMQMALDLAQNFLLLTRVEAEPGRRRIIKISYEHHVETLAEGGSWRRTKRWIGWGAHTEQIETPAVSLGRCFHLEVEAPDGTQVTRAVLGTWPRLTGTDTHDDRDPDLGYPDFPEAASDGKQRVHLHVSVPPSTTGSATIYLRPRPATIVRAGAITAGLTSALLLIVALHASTFQANVGSAAALLLIVPGGLAAYVARPREPHVATHLLFGLRFLTLCCGLWAFLAAGTLVVGRTCSDSSAAGLTCKTWSGTGYVVGVWAACAFGTLLVLVRAHANATRPPERAI